MNVSELKEIIKDLPDDMEVKGVYYDAEYLSEYSFEFYNNRVNEVGNYIELLEIGLK